MLHFSQDAGHWTETDSHYALFDDPDPNVTDDFEAQLAAYLEANPEITTVYVTGHSLGAAMANTFMEAHPDGTYGVNYESITFATPG